MVSGESSIYCLPTEFESEYNSSIIHHFSNDSKFSNSFVLQVDAEVNFALALSYSRTPRLTRNGEYVTIIHKKKQTSVNEKMMVLFTAIKRGWNDYSITFKMK